MSNVYQSPDLQARYEAQQAVLRESRSASDTQVGGTHYKDLAVEPWSALEAWLTPEQFQGYLLGTAIAYFARANHKAALLEDVEKGIHTAQKLVEVLKGK